MDRESALVGLMSGGASGVSYVATSHPFDTVKTVMQMRVAKDRHASRSSIHVARELLQNGGLRTMYRGIWPPLVGTFALRSVQFGTYAWAMDITRPSSDEEGQGILSRWRVFGAQWNTLVSGAIAGATRTVLECPMELLKVRQQVGQSWTLSSLYVGWQATLYRNVALCTLFYGAADALKPFRDGMNPLMNGFFLGSIVATGVWWIIFPFDTLKSQVQTSSIPTTMTERAIFIFREQGMSGFFRGVTPGLLRSFIGNGFGMIAYELVRILATGHM